MEHPAKKYQTIQLLGPVHQAMKLAVAAERTAMTKVMDAALRAWLSNGRQTEPAPESLKRDGGGHAYIDPELHQEVKLACAGLRTTMTAVANAVAVKWLRNHGHGKVLEMFAASE